MGASKAGVYLKKITARSHSLVTALADPDTGGSPWRQGKTLKVLINLHCKAVVF